MVFLKSLLNGVGSGSGVAWPLFGILFAVLGGAIASFFSLTLGAISIALFFTVGCLIFYFSYQEQKDNEKLFQNQFHKNQHKLVTDINEYIKSIYIYSSYKKNVEDSNELFKRILIMDLNKIGNVDANSPLYNILTALKEEYELNQCIPNDKNVLKNIAYKSSKQSVPASKKMIPAFSAFVGTFGSIAGSCAGVSGLLTGMGIFSGFAAFPLLGWGVLLFALISGAALAYEAFTESIDDFKKIQLNLMMKNMHQQLSKATMERNLNAALYNASISLSFKNIGEWEDTSINQRIFASPYFRNLHGNKRILSFFNMNQAHPQHDPVLINRSLQCFL